MKRFYILFLLFIPLVYAENYTYNYNLIANQSLNITYNISENYYNHNINCVYNLSCLVNQTTTINKCTVSRDMHDDENYVLSDANCDINFHCEECNCKEQENKSYSVKWRWYSQNGSICYDYLNKNISDCYDNVGSDFDFTNSWDVDCPQTSNEECDNEQFVPANITEDEWYWYCFIPYSDNANKFMDLVSKTSDFQNKLILDIASMAESNKQLSAQNGEMKQKLVDFDSYKMQFDYVKQQNDECQLTISKHKDLSIWLWILGITNGSLILGWLLIWMFKKVSGIEEFMERRK